ncbi:hypothetical protein LPJ64_005775 [Coemansia asiatica]|uniref:ZZ-type domain-containing protein n=1 Tax=Coemansia asiatica TaxID=1052880 RepID=A0A9W8CHR1_9FUNG|nr:hypothetical protein LPJ64_005775 [Coemansia asiatica]
MLFGSSQLTSAVEQIDAKISELEAEIVNASSEAQARVSRDLKRAWESVYNALSFSPTPGGMANSYTTWAANSSPRVRSAAPPNVPLGPSFHPTPASVADTSGDKPQGSDACNNVVDVNTAASSITCGQCHKDVGDVLWVCTTCKGLYRMCNTCKEKSSGPCSILGHRLVAWPVKRRTLAGDQYVICDHCKGAVVGLRWRCGTCESFDSCNDCYVKHGRKDSHEHELKATYLSDTEAYPTETVTYSCSKCKSGIKSQQNAVLCCLRCIDFHLCAACFAQDDTCISHDYCALAHPGKSIAAAAAAPASASVPVPAVGVVNAVQEQVPFNSMHSKHRGKAHWKHGPQQTSIVSALCDECNKAITGIRHKCTRCKDYDLCNECYSDVTRVHPGHGFVHFGMPSTFGPPGRSRGRGGKHGSGGGSDHHHHNYPHPHPHPHAHPHVHSHPHSPHHPCFQHPLAHADHPHSDNHREHGKEKEQEHGHEKGIGHAAAHAAGKPPHRLSVCRLVHPPFDDVPLLPTTLPDMCSLPLLPLSPSAPPMPQVPLQSQAQPQPQPQPQCPPLLSRPPSCMMPRLPSSPSCCVCPRIACISSCQSKEVHSGVVCDFCDQPIAGVRYKCGNCIDYDLCERCEANNDHNKDHLFIKIRRHIRAPVNKPMLPMVFPSVIASQLKPSESLPRQAQEPIKTSSIPASASATATASIHAPPRAAASVSFNKGTANVTETSQFSAIFVEDVTIPDGTAMQANERFVKIWSVANMGDSEWPKGTMLVHMNGSPGMPGTRNVSHVVVGKRYEQVGIAVDLCAPSKPGRHTSMWRLMTPQGQYFGSMLWCTIEVQAAEINKANDDKTKSAAESEQNSRLQMAKPEEADANEISGTNSNAASIGASSPSAAASIESLSSAFVKIGADLMSEIKRIEGSVRELQLRQEKLESLSSNNGSNASLLIHNSNKATSTASIASADRAVSPIDDIAKNQADTTRLLMHHCARCPSSDLLATPEAAEPAGDHYSDIDLAKSPMLALLDTIGTPSQSQNSSSSLQQQQQETRVAPWSPAARSDASSMRDFYSSAARLEDLLMSSRTGSRINTGSQPSSTSHTNHTSRTSLAFTDGGITSDVDVADEYELINDFSDHSSMSPHSRHV